MSESDPIVGKKLGDYMIVDILGQGGMARVYRGMDKNLNRYAAVKVIDAHLIREDQEEYRQRFTNEARAIARLNHPNIVGIYQFDQVGTLYYMAMSFVEGKDLRTILKNHIKNGTRMSYAEIAQVIWDMGDALDYAHSQGVIHRDIKPSNIMVTNNGRAILTDFGLALNVPEGTMGNTFGSAHYIAPEQAVSSAQAVPQSDIYGLGVVLFEMLTNRVPFNDPSAMAVAMKHLNEPPPPPSRVNSTLPPKVDQVVLRALEKDPKKRFPTGAAMAQALDAALIQVGDQIESDSQVKPLPSWGEPPSSLSRPSRTGSTARRDASAARLLQMWDSGEKTPTRGRNLDDSPTVSDSKGSAATGAQLMTDVPSSSRRRLLFGGALLLLIIALFVVVAVISSNSSNTVATATPQPTLAVAALATPTISVEMFLPTVAATTLVSTELPTAEQTIEAPTPTSLPTNPIPTVVPSSVPTNPPEATPITSAVDPNAPVLLRYDDESLTLLNQSQGNVNVSNLTFVQIRADGNSLDFDSSRWDNGTRPVTALPVGTCFQVMRDDLAQVDMPDYCHQRHAWSRVSFIHWFWKSDDPSATFEVKRGSKVLATCSIEAGECAFNPA